VLALAGVTGHLPALSAALAAALCGAMLGFAPFNRPVARLFLGDVGSLPIGLITAYALFELAAAGHLAAAIILPLYHLADATLTLARRLARGEAVWQAHRSHFYQQATDNGFTVTEVSGTVFALNLALAALALLTLAQPTTAAAIPALALAALLVGATLRRFARPRRVRPA
jgi:UDP-N-acetylmuramyl pentapeptide phosphotransferase/UDP-N-acetylglucosamine-1-phosphate transferase